MNLLIKRFVFNLLNPLFIILITSFSLQANEINKIKSNQESINASIKEQEKKIATNQALKQALIDDLKKQEIAISDLLTSIDENKKQIKTLNQEIALLTPQIAKLKEQQQKHLNILAKQLEITFKIGKTSSMDLVFSGSKSERNERIITYFDYINKSRQKEIMQIKQLQEEISTKQQNLNTRFTKLENLTKEQNKKHISLVSEQKKQRQTISKLDTIIKKDTKWLETLIANEAELKKQLLDAEKQTKNNIKKDEDEAVKITKKQQSENYLANKDEIALISRVSGIGIPTHSFNWPVKGNLLFKFGQPIQGELRWKGVVIKSNEGEKVKSIAGGKVILANWLQGYGYLVAINHGKNDMTLYGYNQRLLVKVGDNIEQGQEIALVGRTGGQSTPSLYFEVRRDGVPLDPSAWLIL